MNSCCSLSNSHVIDSRLVFDGTKIRRRRECFKCFTRWTTFEEIKKDEIFVLGQCPLCKGEAILEETTTEVLIRCMECKLTLKRMILEGKEKQTKRALIKRWNTREL